MPVAQRGDHNKPAQSQFGQRPLSGRQLCVFGLAAVSLDPGVGWSVIHDALLEVGL